MLSDKNNPEVERRVKLALCDYLAIPWEHCQADFHRGRWWAIHVPPEGEGEVEWYSVTDSGDGFRFERA